MVDLPFLSMKTVLLFFSNCLVPPGSRPTRYMDDPAQSFVP